MMFQRLYRLNDAARYLGMGLNLFNHEVRPYLTEVPIGKQGIGFDRLELDAWADHHIAANGRPARKEGLWPRGYLASTSGAHTGGLTSESKVMADWQRARERAT